MTDNQYSDEMRKFAQSLFGSGDEPDEPDEPHAPIDISGGNVIPKEGQTISPPKGDELREFVRRLFHGVNPHDHTSN